MKTFPKMICRIREMVAFGCWHATWTETRSVNGWVETEVSHLMPQNRTYCEKGMWDFLFQREESSLNLPSRNGARWSLRALRCAYFSGWAYPRFETRRFFFGLPKSKSTASFRPFPFDDSIAGSRSSSDWHMTPPFTWEQQREERLKEVDVDNGEKAKWEIECLKACAGSIVSLSEIQRLCRLHVYILLVRTLNSYCLSQQLLDS